MITLHLQKYIYQNQIINLTQLDPTKSFQATVSKLILPTFHKIHLRFKLRCFLIYSLIANLKKYSKILLFLDSKDVCFSCPPIRKNPVHPIPCPGFMDPDQPGSTDYPARNFEQSQGLPRRRYRVESGHSEFPIASRSVDSQQRFR